MPRNNKSFSRALNVDDQNMPKKKQIHNDYIPGYNWKV